VNDADEVIAAARENPDLLFPFAQLRRSAESGELVLDGSTRAILEAQLETGLMHGIGEISVRHNETPSGPPGGDQNEADGEVLMDVYALAADWGIPVNVHVDVDVDVDVDVEYEYVEELSAALTGSPDTTFIWAHLGDAPPDVVRSMVEAHDNLYGDTACRNPYYERNGRSTEEQSLTDEGVLLPEWAALFDDHPDRFLFGTDLGRSDRHEQLDQVLEHAWTVLDQVGPEAREGIAEGNARVLLGLDYEPVVHTSSAARPDPMAAAGPACIDDIDVLKARLQPTILRRTPIRGRLEPLARIRHRRHGSMRSQGPRRLCPTGS